MKPALLLVLVAALIGFAGCGNAGSSKRGIGNPVAQVNNCQNEASRWAQAADAANGDIKLTLVSAGYSSAKQSCVVYYKSENPPVATYAVEDLVTHAPYANEDCSMAQKNCDTAQAKSKAVFDELTKTTVSAKK